MRKFDLGSWLLLPVLIVTLLLFCKGEPEILYDDAQTLEMISCGAYDDGIFEYDTLEFYAINADYESKFLSIPATYEGFTVDSVNASAFHDTPVQYVLLPDTIVSLSYGRSDLTMYTDNEKVIALCAERGFTVGSTETYYALLEEASRSAFGLQNIAPNFAALAGTPWIIAVVLGLYLFVLFCANLREKAGYENPLAVLKKKGSITNTLFLLVQVASAFIAFYFFLYETEEIGLDSEWLMDIMTNWPLKITLVLAAIVLISDIFNKNFIPWYFGRVLVRLVRVLIPVAIACGLGAFIGTISLQFRFIVHLIAAAPLPLFFFVCGGLACALFVKLGLYTKEPTPALDFGSDSSEPRRGRGTTTLIGPDGTSYPVHNVGYGYMVNGKMLLDFDPHGTNRPVDEDGTEYTRY